MLTSRNWKHELIQKHLQQSAAVKRKTAQYCLDSVAVAADLIAGSLAAGGKLLICGNGGSAADSQHLAAEFVSRLTRDFERPGLAAIALTTDTSFLTAFANDCGFDGIFSRQVQALGRTGDVLLGITTSGNSQNIIDAVETARKGGIATIALTNQSGGKLSGLVDVAICIPDENTQYIQEAHLAIEHLLCALVEKELFPSYLIRLKTEVHL